MANKIVKYQLEGGTIPSWIDDGGYYPDPSEIMIGATVDGSDETGLGELASEADVKTYLDTYTSSWTEKNGPNDEETPFDQTAAAANIWSKKIG
jgi:hypothetical protein